MNKYYFRAYGNVEADRLPRIAKIILVTKDGVSLEATAFKVPQMSRLDKPKPKREKTITECRIKNIVVRMLNGDEFYTNNMSPHISRDEIKVLNEKGLRLQREATHGADRVTPWAVYPLDNEKFREVALRLYPDITNKIEEG